MMNRRGIFNVQLNGVSAYKLVHSLLLCFKIYKDYQALWYQLLAEFFSGYNIAVDVS